MIRHHLEDVEDEEPDEILRVIRCGGWERDILAKPIYQDLLKLSNEETNTEVQTLRLSGKFQGRLSRP